MEGNEAAKRLQVGGPRCPFCHEPLRSDDEKVGCPGCMGWQHTACLAENHGRCAACSHEITSASRADGAARAGALERSTVTRDRGSSRRALASAAYAALALVMLVPIIILAANGRWLAVIALGLGELLMVALARAHLSQGIERARGPRRWRFRRRREPDEVPPAK